MLLDKMHIGSFIGKDSDFLQATEWIKAYIVMTDSSVSKTLLDWELEEKTILLSENLQRKGTLTSEEVKNILKEIKN